MRCSNSAQFSLTPLLCMRVAIYLMPSYATCTFSFLDSFLPSTSLNQSCQYSSGLESLVIDLRSMTVCLNEYSCAIRCMGPVAHNAESADSGCSTLLSVLTGFTTIKVPVLVMNSKAAEVCTIAVSSPPSILHNSLVPGIASATGRSFQWSLRGGELNASGIVVMFTPNAFNSSVKWMMMSSVPDMSGVTRTLPPSRRVHRNREANAVSRRRCRVGPSPPTVTCHHSSVALQVHPLPMKLMLSASRR